MTHSLFRTFSALCFILQEGRYMICFLFLILDCTRNFILTFDKYQTYTYFILSSKSIQLLCISIQMFQSHTQNRPSFSQVSLYHVLHALLIVLNAPTDHIGRLRLEISHIVCFGDFSGEIMGVSCAFGWWVFLNGFRVTCVSILPHPHRSRLTLTSS